MLECIISTHALTEGDDDLLPIGTVSLIFQLTPSRRATITLAMQKAAEAFQLTPSRRATSLYLSTPVPRNISTHALTEGDSGGHVVFGSDGHFNSRPHGGRQKQEG